MAFWDFLSKWFGDRKPDEAPTPTTPANSITSDIAPPTAVPITSDAPLPVAAPQASDFLPIARDDLLQQGEDVRRTTGWMWFGRRDMIPPTSDPRTLLIDRGMLTQGLLTADDLAAMHQTGDEWHKYASRIDCGVNAGPITRNPSGCFPFPTSFRR